MRLARKITNACRMPVIAARQSGGFIHSLLYYGPFPGLAYNKRVEINLESVDDSVIVDPGCEPAGSDQRLAIDAAPFGKGPKLIRSAARLLASSSANINSQFMCTRIQPTFQRSHHRRCDAGGVPVHAHHASERLKPHRVADAGQKLGYTVMMNNAFGNGCPELLHSDGQPCGYTPAMQGKIGMSGTLHRYSKCKQRLGNNDSTTMKFLALVRRKNEEFSEAQIAAYLEPEAERVRELYTQGVFRAVYSRADVKGAVVELECASVEEAHQV